MANDQQTNGEDQGPPPEIRQALDRLYALEDEASERHALVLKVQGEVDDLRSQINKLVNQLSEVRRAPERPKTKVPTRREQELEATIRARRNEMRRKAERRDQLGEQMQAANRLAENCRAWLTSGGASIESLEAGMPVPARGGAYATPEGRKAEGQRAAQEMFGVGGY